MKFNITTLGCKVNQFESGSVSQLLAKSGWKQDQTCKNVDICIINTCTVTEKASAQSRQAIRKAIRSSPKAVIIVTGCYAQTEAQEIEKIKGVDHVVGQKDKHKIPEIISGMTKGSLPSVSDTFSEEINSNENLTEVSQTTLEDRTRPFLKIQDGCNAFCTYCVVPFARGRSSSMPFSHVLKSIKHINDQGYNETVLTGIHLGCYGLDLSPKTNLFELLKSIDKMKSTKRVRLSSVEPKELTKDIIKLVANSDCMCSHFHIPLQSGDDHILKKMKRPYTASYFRSIVEDIHGLTPDAAIGVDTLIGFPGETQEAFENTYRLIQELPVTYLHVFPFSPRKQTPASKYPGKVKPDTLKSRCGKIRSLGRKKKREFYKKAVGRSVKVLIEGKRDNATGLLKGLTANYIPVLVNGDDSLKNSFINVKIVKLNRSDTVQGVRCDGDP